MCFSYLCELWGEAWWLSKQKPHSQPPKPHMPFVLPSWLEIPSSFPLLLIYIELNISEMLCIGATVLRLPQRTMWQQEEFGRKASLPKQVSKLPEFNHRNNHCKAGTRPQSRLSQPVPLHPLSKLQPLPVQPHSVLIMEVKLCLT